MTSNPPASLLALLAGSVVLATLTGCSAAVGASKADASPDDDDGCGGPMVDAGDSGVDAPRGPMLDAGDSGVDAPQGTTCAPVSAETPVGVACLSDMESLCPSLITSCNAGCSCSTFVSGCLEGGPSALGIVECLSATQDPVAGQIFDCIYFSAPCNQTSQAVDAGAGD
jgi:hypothetical protein